MAEALVALSAKFPHVKFVKIPSTSAVENWPDRNLPTLFLYHDGELQHQMLTLKSLGGVHMAPAGTPIYKDSLTDPLQALSNYVSFYLFCIIIVIITCHLMQIWSGGWHRRG
jgi:hypothetical protein